MIGYRVENTGVIEAPQGTIGLAAAKTVLLQPQGNKRLWIQTAVSSEKDGTGISQEGMLRAMQVELQSDGNPYAYAIQSDGWIEGSPGTFPSARRAG